MATIRKNPDSARSHAAIVEGERRLTLLHTQFDRFERVQHAISTSYEQRAARDARQATIIATAGAAGALFLIFFFSGYLTRAILRPSGVRPGWPARSPPAT